MGRLIRLSDVGGLPSGDTASRNEQQTSDNSNNSQQHRTRLNADSPLSSHLLSRSKDANKENTDSPLPKYKRDLVQKMKVLRGQLNELPTPSGHCRLEISREEIFEVILFFSLCVFSALLKEATSTFKAHNIICFRSYLSYTCHMRFF